jgi:CDP-diacylglycerol--glycerol-3-phosphate 3-phosphatidyltransferase
VATLVDKKLRQKLFTVPNQLTAARLVLAVLLFVLISWGRHGPALVVFLIAAATDWLDGFWARRYGQVTKVGRIFDPFVDKIIICGAFILLAIEMNDMPGGVRGWMAIVVVAREMLVTSLRSFIERSGGDFSASMAGKLKMGFQCVAVAVSLLALDRAGEPGWDWLLWAMPIAIWTAVILTIYSGVAYVAAAAKMLRI